MKMSYVSSANPFNGHSFADRLFPEVLIPASLVNKPSLVSEDGRSRTDGLMPTERARAWARARAASIKIKGGERARDRASEHEQKEGAGSAIESGAALCLTLLDGLVFVTCKISFI